MASISRALFFLTVLYFSSLSALAESEAAEFSFGYQTSTCSYAEDIIREQLQLLHMRHNTTSFSWLRIIFDECFVESSCDAPLLLDSTRRVMAEKEANGGSEMRSFRFIESLIKEALEDACQLSRAKPVRNESLFGWFGKGTIRMLSGMFDFVY